MLSACDRLAIAELLARRYHYADHGDYDALRACYTADVVIEIEGAGRFTGVDWQVSHARDSYVSNAGGNRHVITNLWIEPEGSDRAVAHYFLINMSAGQRVGEPHLRVTGSFADHVLRQADGWVVCRRVFVPDQPFQLQDPIEK